MKTEKNQGNKDLYFDIMALQLVNSLLSTYRKNDACFLLHTEKHKKQHNLISVI